jgi:hypothetical protein
MDNMQKCVLTEKSVCGQNGGNEMEEGGTGSVEAELQATL